MNIPFDIDMESISQALMEDLMQELDLPEIDNEEAVYRFAQLEDAIQAAQLVGTMYEGDSQLVRYQNDYYLVLLKQDCLTDGCLALLAEFGEGVRTAAPFFQEHGQIIIAERALEVLASL